MLTVPKNQNMMTRLCWISRKRIYLPLFHQKDSWCLLIYPLPSLCPNGQERMRLMMRRQADVVDGFRSLTVPQRSWERAIPCLMSSERHRRPCANLLLHHLLTRKNGNWRDGG